MIKLFSYYFCVACILCYPLIVSAVDKQKMGSAKKEIHQLTNSLEGEKEKSDKVYAEIKAMEQELGSVSKQKYQTEKKIKVATRKLQKSIEKNQNLKIELDTQREALAQQLQALYSAGEQSHLRLLLRQDDPSEISRTMKYFEYLNDSRVNKIKKTQAIFNKLKKAQMVLQEEREGLQVLTKQLDEQEKGIKQLVSQRSQRLKKLKTTISGQEKRLSRLLSQEKEFQIVVNKVAEKANKVDVYEREEITETVPEKNQVIKKVQAGETVKIHAVPNKPLTKLKGSLSWPVEGKIIHRYGSKRNGHQKWNGVVLAAKGGSKVRAVAKGEVVFADWMDGYGYLIIIQHDKNYLSLYGYNRSVFKKEGEKIKANEVIAEVGNSGGQSQNALYFEIRKGQSPQNPSRWCRK